MTTVIFIIVWVKGFYRVLPHSGNDNLRNPLFHQLLKPKTKKTPTKCMRLSYDKTTYAIFVSNEQLYFTNKIVNLKQQKPNHNNGNHLEKTLRCLNLKTFWDLFLLIL